MAQAFRPLPGKTVFATVTTTGTAIQPPPMIGIAGSGSENEQPLSAYNTVRISNVSSAALLINLNGATATTSACDGCIAQNGFQDFFLSTAQNVPINLSALSGSTQAAVSFGNTVK